MPLPKVILPIVVSNKLSSCEIFVDIISPPLTIKSPVIIVFSSTIRLPFTFVNEPAALIPIFPLPKVIFPVVVSNKLSSCETFVDVISPPLTIKSPDNVVSPVTVKEPFIVPPILSNLLSKFPCNSFTSLTWITAALKLEFPLVNNVVFTKPDVANLLLSIFRTLPDSGAFNIYPCPLSDVIMYAFRSS